MDRIDEMMLIRQINDLRLETAQIRQYLTILLNAEGYEIDPYGNPIPSQELLDEQREQEQESQGAKIKQRTEDEDED